MTSVELSRRRAIRVAAAFALSVAAPGGRAAQAATLRVAAVLGDSITAGYGLPPRQALPARLQGSYAAAFEDAFASVARAERVLVVPDMLAGVTLNPDLNQPDGIHPNTRGVEVIARRLAPVVARGLPAR